MEKLNDSQIVGINVSMQGRSMFYPTMPMMACLTNGIDANTDEMMPTIE